MEVEMKTEMREKERRWEDMNMISTIYAELRLSTIDSRAG